ncbi:MAG: hypothetical protein HGA75_14745 [Thiobacillus sp.]|nr:hypothetical protein [Thiobacillus sp.]
MKWLLRCAALVLIWPATVLAGSVEGPFLVWFNLATHDPGAADAAIHDFVNGPERLCWEDGALLFMKERPREITPKLVTQALVQRQARAQAKLRRLLRRPFSDIPSFDGIVVYVDRGPARLVSLSVGGRVKSETLLSKTGEMAWGPTFCNVMPPISRKP